MKSWVWPEDAPDGFALFSDHCEQVREAALQSNLTGLQEVFDDENDDPDAKVHHVNTACTEDALLALVVPRLPNLNKLSIKMAMDESIYFIQMIEGAKLRGGPCLSNLRTVNLHCGLEGGIQLSDLATYSELPSLRSLSACNGCYRNPAAKTHTSQSCSYCVILVVKRKPFSDFLKFFQCLQLFVFEYMDPGITNAMFFLTRSVLLAHCNHTAELDSSGATESMGFQGSA